MLALALLSLWLTASAKPATVQIVVDRMSFAQPNVSARVGDTLEWVNRDIVDHTATEKGRRVWDVTLAAGGRAAVTMTKPGVYDYVCRLHPNMTGRVTVRQ